MNSSLPPDAGETLMLPASEETESFAGFWQGSPDELLRLEELLREELDAAAKPKPLSSGPWVNPLEGLQDDSSAEETFLKIFIDDTLLTLDDLTELLLALEGGGTRAEIERLEAFFHRIKGAAAMVGLKRAAKLAHLMEDVLQELLDSGNILSSELTDAMLKSSDALRGYVENLRGGIGLPDMLREAAQALHFATLPETARPRAAIASPREPAANRESEAAAVSVVGHGPHSVPGEGPARGSQTLRVEIGHLDRLMALAGQLTIQNARFHSIMEQFHDDPSDRFRVLFEAVDHLDRISDEIRRGMMVVRMVPIGPLLNRYHRVVRDLTRSSGKLVRLEIHGEKTELDKRMIDELSDPLLQIVRNALDHGIEQRDVRVAAGKPPEGLLAIHAFHRGNSILIQVRDDGAGLDLARLREKGVEKRVVTQAEAEAMTPRQIQALIWKAGMSTAERVTEVSGRGVGMDIVRSKIEGLHGAVDVQSVPGRGTTFSIRLPLTLAILPCLMVVAGGETFAIPMELVKEIVAWDDELLLHAQGGSMVRIRQRVLATMRLDEVLSWHAGVSRQTPSAVCPMECGAGADALRWSSPLSFGDRGPLSQESAAADCGNESRDESPHSKSTETVPATFSSLVIVGEQGHDVGLMVDRVLGQEEVVIKSLAENYRDVPGIAGATILGDGRVALILDIPGLMGLALARGQSRSKPSPMSDRLLQS